MDGISERRDIGDLLNPLPDVPLDGLLAEADLDGTRNRGQM